METIQVTKFKCSLCSTTYSTKKEALSCEGKSVTQNKGVKIGDIITITAGDGCGRLAKVTKVGVIDKSWGHHAWKTYWHTVYVNADILGSFGSRMLTFDSYKI